MSLTNIRYIVFDLNGTLVNEVYLRYDDVFENILGCERRRPERGLTVKDLRDVSTGRCPLSQIIAQLYKVDDPEAVRQQFLDVQASRITFRENAQDILNMLQQHYQLILCSDTTGIAKQVVHNLGLAQYFVAIFYSFEVGYMKSERRFWTTLLKQFPNATPQEFLAIGDNPRADILYPNRLKMHTVKIDNPNGVIFDYRKPSLNTADEQPEYHIQDLEELLELLGLNRDN